MNTTESVSANNKLIAEFMGIFAVDIDEQDGFWYSIDGLMPHGYDKIMLEAIKYNSSWDWLMPVVEKIGELYHQVKIEINEGFPYCEIICYSEGNCVEEFRNENETTIQAIYEVVLEFIKWYNQQK